jgi:hypothetical protein
MGTRIGDQPASQAQDQSPRAQDAAASEPAMIAAPSAAATPSATDAARIEAPAASSVATQPADAESSASSVAAIDAPQAAASQEEATERVRPVAPPKSIVLYRMSARAETAAAADDAATSEAAGTSAKTSSPWPKRVMPLAASIAVAAAVGAMAGSAATAGLGGLRASAPAPAKTADIKSTDMRPLRDTITRLNAELAALKASIENSGRTSNAQFSKLGDRLDRVERAQAEPAAKLAKLTEALDRIERRAPAATSTAHDVTGSITPPATQPAASARPSGPPVIEGWIVRSVYNGAALIQTRYGGVIEVEPGDNLPGLGRIENIRRQDGRWVVLTSRGMIVAR